VEVRCRFRTGQDLDTTITTGQWLTMWLAGRKGLRASTVRSYHTHIHAHLIPVIGHIRLDRLRAVDVGAVFEAIDERSDLVTRARTSGDPALRAQVKGCRVVNAATKHRIRATLRAAMNKAIRERRIDSTSPPSSNSHPANAPRRWSGRPNGSSNGSRPVTPTSPLRGHNKMCMWRDM
jgi:hypothetical protein